MLDYLPDWIKLISGGLGLLIGWLYGAPDALLYVLLSMIALDYVTGVLAAGANKEISSKIGFRGIAKKVIILIIVTVASLLDKVVPVGQEALRSAACFFYIANEAISVLENAAAMGVKLPDKLLQALKIMNDKDKEE